MIVPLTAIAIIISTTGCTSSKARSRRSDIDPRGTEVWNPQNVQRPGDNVEYTYLCDPIYFAYDSSQIWASERTKIENVAESLRQNIKTGVIIEGHCDERGSREYNMALGERRALAVRSYLTGLGIDGSRIYTKSFGEESPDVSGHDEQSWGLNRRAEFVLVD
ncbi:MAG TPA: OmpA family protein [Kiritimatiellia bacterium]|nr:OmpA family protein [Kiritimatiellia bacterium]